MSVKPKLGMVGTGLMGRGLATNLLKAGYPLAYLSRQGAKAELDALGATAAASIGEVSAISDMVLLCVTGTPAVESIMMDPDGVLVQRRSGQIVIDFTTALPASTRKLAKAMAAFGGRFIDAAMTGLPNDAENGAVNLIVGCAEEDIGDVRPVLEAVSNAIHFAGPVGSGHTVKLLHQGVVLGNVAVLAEALACATKSGVDTEVLSAVIGSGGADSKAFQRLRPFILEGDADGFRFSLANACKDMRYYCDLVTDSGVASLVASSIANTYHLADKAGGDGRFVPDFLTLVAALNGVGDRRQAPTASANGQHP